MKTKLRWLCRGSTELVQMKTMEKLMRDFPNDKIIALELGVAYGGGVEAMAKKLKERGLVYGYDTFEGHPADLSDNPNNTEAICMEPWYEKFGTEALDIDYQRKVLKEEGIKNVTLVKGRISKKSFDELKKVHFAMLDLDLVKSMRIAYEGVKDKIVKGGYLFLHDAIPEYHLPLLNEYVTDEILEDKRWKVYLEVGVLLILKRV